MKVSLQNASGQAVYATAIPPYKEPPAVIFYDKRCYLRHGVDGAVELYRECFAYVIGPAIAKPEGDMIDMPSMRDI